MSFWLTFDSFSLISDLVCDSLLTVGTAPNALRIRLLTQNRVVFDYCSGQRTNPERIYLNINLSHGFWKDVRACFSIQNPSL